MQQAFTDRRAAGRELAGPVSVYTGGEQALIIALPRGGVPVAYEVAVATDNPIDILGVGKLGVPGQEELAFGAVATGGTRVLNKHVIRAAQLDTAEVDEITARAVAELERRERLYRNGGKPLAIRGRKTIVIDDGLATGATMVAAVLALRRQQTAAVAIAIPVASAAGIEALASSADELICLRTPDPFEAVGLWYQDFNQVCDEEVCALLGRCRQGPAKPD